MEDSDRIMLRGVPMDKIMEIKRQLDTLPIKYTWTYVPNYWRHSDHGSVYFDFEDPKFAAWFRLKYL